jgi:rubrerythrin
MNVLRFAQEVDQSARNFYEEMASRTENPGVKRIFDMLAEDERELLNRHTQLAAKAQGVDAETLDRGVNVFEQLRRQEDRLSVDNDLAAYRLALDAEREVLQQYRSAANTEARPQARELLIEMAGDEQKHVEELENLYDFASAPNHYLAWGEFSNLGDYHNFGRDDV